MENTTYITSVTHPLVKMIVELHNKKGRREHKAFAVEGYRACTEFSENKYTLLHLCASPAEASKVQNLFPDMPVVTVADRIMDKISTATTPPGILAVFALPVALPTEELSVGVVLANISDPGNMGTLIRSAAAFGYASVVVVEGCDPFSPKVIQACAGALPLVNLFQCDWSTLVTAAKRKNLLLAALVVQNGKPLMTISEKNLLFVVGNEAHGLPQVWVEQCDLRITIPMSGATESLNAAIAGSIALAVGSWK